MGILADHSGDLRWYVLRAISGKENKVKTHIDAEIKNEHFQGLVTDAMVPTEKVFVNRNGKKVLKERNYLPGYVLVRCVLTSDVAFKLTNVPEVLGFLTEGTNPADMRPAPIRDAEAQRLLGQSEAQPYDEEAAASSFQAGQKVKVTDGPFSGFEGLVEEVMAERKMLKVIVTIFNRKTPLELDFMQVEKVTKTE